MLLRLESFCFLFVIFPLNGNTHHPMSWTVLTSSIWHQSWLHFRNQVLGPHISDGPHISLAGLLKTWQGSQVAWLFQCLQSWPVSPCIQIAAVTWQIGPRGWERSLQGAYAKCPGVCTRVTKQARSYFQKNRDTCFCLLFFHIYFRLYLCTLEFVGIWFPRFGALVFSTFRDVSLWVALPEPFLESSVLHPGMWYIGSLTRLFPLLHVLSAQVPNRNYIHVYIKGK